MSNQSGYSSGTDEGKLTKKQWDQPISPYVADTYNTLFSVVQGVAFGALFYVISTEVGRNASPTSLSIPFIVKSFVVLMLIALMWHRYAIQNQYAIWRLESRDTLIPIFFAAAQSALALSLQSGVAWFSSWLSVISFLGVYAYKHSYWRYGRAETLEILNEHFTESSGIPIALVKESQKFHILQMLLLLVSGTVNLALTVFNSFCVLADENIKSFLTAGIALIIIFFSLACDLQWYLKRSKNPVIRKFFYNGYRRIEESQNKTF